jgi:hypothetical protein
MRRSCLISYLGQVVIDTMVGLDKDSSSGGLLQVGAKVDSDGVEEEGSSERRGAGLRLRCPQSDVLNPAHTSAGNA